MLLSDVCRVHRE